MTYLFSASTHPSYATLFPFSLWRVIATGGTRTELPELHRVCQSRRLRTQPNPTTGIYCAELHRLFHGSCFRENQLVRRNFDTGPTMIPRVATSTM